MPVPKYKASQVVDAVRATHELSKLLLIQSPAVDLKQLAIVAEYPEHYACIGMQLLPSLFTLQDALKA